MGVPKFYRWLSERYPCLSEVVKEYQIPEFDNFYLDMNGIIHNCSHPNDDDVHFRISEEKIFADIFHYLEALFRLVRPRKLFFMAIDGVAPRAKMNQQRGRRFRSAKEAEQREAEARRKGETLPDEARFDSNCITPGTEFMVKLHEQLKYFVTMKISTDPLWQNVQVILSGHQVPGEGEHKIVEYIRHQRSQPGYDCNTRHCLYGLDADLMMLGLCTHEPYFSLLREEVKFGKKSKNDKRPTTVEQTTFHLLHLSLMRDYLDHEFSSLKNKLPFPYNLESIIDDWVLMGFLVGNDFIPHLPNFHIAKGALPMLYNAYMEVMPTLSGYINEGGVLNLQRFQMFMEKVAQIDYDNFNDIYADLKWFEDKRGRKSKAPREGQPTKDSNVAENVRTSDAEKFLAEKLLEVELLLGGEDTVDEENGCESSSSEEEEEDSSESETETELFDGDQMLHAEFRAHKRNYYMEKLEYADVTSEVLKDQAEGYVRAIQWNLHYYYNGVCSWSWYFPHHYAPYASDIKNFATSVDMNFDLGKPFLPYQQLLGVLPAASRKLLPEAFQSLMTSANSPIIQFYPADFETDKNGKQQEWEAVVLIPFIDEVRLIDAMTECESKITTAEKERNKHGPMQIYFYSDTDLGAYHAPGYFSPVLHNQAACREVPREHFVLPPGKILKGLHPNIDLSICVSGFPTLRHIRHKGALKKAGVTVFNMSSQHESMVLEVEANEAATSIHQMAERILSKTVLINWPHLVEAKVVALADKEWKYSLEPDAARAKNKDKPSGKCVKEQVTPDMAAEWRLSDKGLRERYASRWGVEISTTEILLYVCPILGRKYIYTQNGRVTLEKQWATETVPFCYQMAVMDVQVADRVGKQYRTLEELFPAGSVCFMLGHPGYGSQGQVLSADPQLKGKLRVSFSTVPEPNYEAMRKKWRSTSTQYLPAYAAARASNMSSHLLSRITGTVYINLTKKEDDEGKDREKGRPGRVNVGLNLKFNKKNEEVPGWSRKSGTTWLYSQKTIETLRQYVEKFPEFFDYVFRNVGNDVYDEKDLFPGPEGHSRMCELIEWVQGLPCLQAERQACGTFSVEQDLIPEIAAFIGKQDPVAHKPVVMQVRPHLLYKPSLSFGPTIPDPSAKYQLLDRVINVREGFCVPLGLKGTVISIKTAANPMDEIYEVLFDSEFSGGMTVKGLENSSRIYRLPPWALINISHGRRVNMEREMQGRPIAVVYPTGAPEAARQGPGPRGPPQARPEAQAKTPRPKTDEPRGKPSAAPAPSLLPKPQGSSWRSGEQQPVEQKQQPEFDAIWKALSQQQPPAPAPARGPQVKEKQNQKRPTQQEKSQNKPFPSLQEAAKALPQIPIAAAETKKSTAAPTKLVASEQKPAALTAPPPVQGTPAAASVLGPSLSVQDLFQMAGQGQVLLPPPPVPPVIPIQAPVVSNCIQLLNFCQQKALGVPLYTYVPLSGSFAAEIKLPGFGVISKATGVSQEEAAEKAAAIALQHPVLHQPLAMAVPFPGVPVMPPHFGPLPPHPMPAPFPLMGFPQPMVRYPTTFNNLVPLQVTRQKVHQASRPPQQHLQQQQPHRQQQQPQQQRGPRKSESRQDPETAQAATTLQQQQSADPGPAVVAPALVPSEPRKIVNVGKPPGSRLAIRFGSPGK